MTAALPPDRPMGALHARPTMGGEFQSEKTLFGSGDQSNRPPNPRERFAEDRTPFIQYPGEMCAPRLQRLGDRRIALAATDFLIFSKSEHDGPLWLESGGREPVGRFQDCNKWALIVDRAPAP